jgi:hypothetical protein
MEALKEWSDVIKTAARRIRDLHLSKEYVERLKVELEQIDMQGANEYWMDLIRENKKFDHNKNGLVLPFLLGLTPLDPIKGDNGNVPGKAIPHRWERHPDVPD